MSWLDDTRIVIAGIGIDDAHMVEGARVFDVTGSGVADPEWRSDLNWALRSPRLPARLESFSPTEFLFSRRTSLVYRGGVLKTVQ